MRLHPFKKIISPFWQWVLFLVLLPILELFFLLHCFGTLFTLVSMLVSGLLGVSLAYREGFRYWIELNQQLDRDEVPTSPVLHGAVILSAALFMILPGLLTSLLGLALLCRIPRSFVVAYLALQFETHRLRSRKGDAPHSPDTIDI